MLGKVEQISDCVPLAPFTFDFTNALDIERFDPTFVRVEPAVPGLRVDVNGDFISVRGATAGNTTLMPRFSQVRLIRLPSSDGISPVSSLPPRSMKTRLIK